MPNNADKSSDKSIEQWLAAARAFAVAETALHRAIARLSGDATYAGDANLAVDGGTAAISVSASAQQICLSWGVEILASVAVRGGRAQARVKATADQAIYPFQWGLFAADGPLLLASQDPSRVPWSKIDSYDSRLGSYNPVTNGGGRARVGAKGDGVILNNVDLVGDVVGDWVSSVPNPVTNLGPALKVWSLSLYGQKACSLACWDLQAEDSLSLPPWIRSSLCRLQTCLVLPSKISA